MRPDAAEPPAPELEAKVLLFVARMASDILAKPEGNLADASQRSRSYAPWIKIALVAALMGILFGTVLIHMARDWWNEPAWSQGMLLPPLAIYLAWLHREQTLSHTATLDRRGLLLIAFACFTFVVGNLAAEFFLARISFVILLTGLIWTFWGTPRLRTLAFPLLLLATMVPLPVIFYNSLAAPLQLLASDLATQIAQAIGISVFRDGNIIQLAGMSLGVEDACSGLNSLSALTVGSLLLGYLLCSRLLSRITLFLAAIPLAIFINIVRVAGTAMIADHNQEYALGFYHSFSGWLVFVAGFGCLYLFALVVHAILDPK
jgi:exosortase